MCWNASWTNWVWLQTTRGPFAEESVIELAPKKKKKDDKKQVKVMGRSNDQGGKRSEGAWGQRWKWKRPLKDVEKTKVKQTMKHECNVEQGCYSTSLIVYRSEEKCKCKIDKFLSNFNLFQLIDRT